MRKHRKQKGVNGAFLVLEEPRYEGPFSNIEVWAEVAYRDFHQVPANEDFSLGKDIGSRIITETPQSSFNRGLYGYMVLI